MPQYSEGDVVTYKPVGGPDSNTSESTGTIKSVTEDGRYMIENKNTGKTGGPYNESNVMGKA